MTSIRPDGRVEFRFFRPRAMDVKVLGTFNEWGGEPLTLQPDLDPGAQGWWSAVTTIQAGEYRFRYWADGHWFTDFASHGVEKGKYGWNSVLVVPQKSQFGARPSELQQHRFEYDIELKSAA